MTERKSRFEQNSYICGQCSYEIIYLRSEPKPIPCPECDWWHAERKKYDLPSDIKLDLTQY